MSGSELSTFSCLRAGMNLLNLDSAQSGSTGMEIEKKPGCEADTNSVAVSPDPNAMCKETLTSLAVFEKTISPGVLEKTGQKPDIEISLSSNPSTPPKTYRILIAEDSSMNLRIIQRMIIDKITDGSIVFDIAKDGSEAVTKAQANRYHLIFMDFIMPNCKGDEAVRKIRAFDTLTPIIVQSDSSKEELDAAFDGLLIQGRLGRKLSNPNQIHQAIEEHCQSVDE